MYTCCHDYKLIVKSSLKYKTELWLPKICLHPVLKH